MNDRERDEMLKETHDTVIRIEAHQADHERRIGELEKPKSEHPGLRLTWPKQVEPWVIRLAVAYVALKVLGLSPGQALELRHLLGFG